MHQPGDPDPAPDSEHFRSDVLCDHDGLVHAAQGRAKINSAVGSHLAVSNLGVHNSHVQACSYLVDLFPTWTPVPADREPCEVCGAAFESSKPSRSATKLQVSLEKARAVFLQANTICADWLVD